jgi:hypothetical protein
MLQKKKNISSKSKIFHFLPLCEPPNWAKIQNFSPVLGEI